MGEGCGMSAEYECGRRCYVFSPSLTQHLCPHPLQSAGNPGLRPWKQLELLQAEVRAYSPALAELPAVVLANKVDLLDRPSKIICSIRARTDLPVLGVSAAEGSGLEPVMGALKALWAGDGIGADSSDPNDSAPCPATALDT